MVRIGGLGEDAPTFDELNLAIDKRLDKALMKCAFVRSTLVQAKSLPLALAGKDLLVRARTGSGKTLVYLLPVLHKVLLAKDREEAEQAIRAIILVPTRELVSQVHQQINALIYYCRDVVQVSALSSENTKVQQTWLQALPDVVIATPGRLALHLKTLSDELKLRESVETFVVDEADLVFSYGYAEDVTKIVSQLPRTVQSMLMSATLNADVRNLRKLVLHDPEVVKLRETLTDGHLAQWYCSLKKDDKDVLLFALLRLKLVHGKTLFFVNSVDRAYYIKLLLDQFQVRAAVLNAELPINSRLHILDQFNRGTIDYLIATDDAIDYPDVDEEPTDAAEDAEIEDEDEGEDEDEDKNKDDDDDDDDEIEDEDSDKNSDHESDSNAEKSVSEESESEAEAEADAKVVAKTSAKAANKKKRKRQENDDDDDDENGEFGVARGIDFKDVSTVINIDVPTSFEAYVHRIGRTARGGAAGTALTLICEDSPSDVEMLAKIQANQGMDQGEPQPALLALDMKEIDGFRYRVSDVRLGVTKRAVKDARLREVKKELANSEKLKAHFDDNPTDLALIKHDLAIRPNKVNRHIANIPDYLMPSMFKNQDALKPKTYNVDFHHSTSRRLKYQKRHKVGKFRTEKSFKAMKAKSRKKKGSNPLF
eukprot:CAMPEP_0184548440 /NCGR_PEP_ID=MMETSP0199_2-20130426/6204_1 /TAXON_ID=1112570 /ORGANISM="Thraustochytrium sp., Strain LLF1b" /LENGTH=651 /DNA_ID=CAMNT_0026943053 /DNA_START=148 /DNA_END=2103 /DNA_ORIENTATION=-